MCKERRRTGIAHTWPHSSDPKNSQGSERGGGEDSTAQDTHEALCVSQVCLPLLCCQMIQLSQRHHKQCDSLFQQPLNPTTKGEERETPRCPEAPEAIPKTSILL